MIDHSTVHNEVAENLCSLVFIFLFGVVVGYTEDGIARISDIEE